MNTKISDSPTQNIQRSDKAVFEVLMMNNYSAMENKILNVGFTMKKISAENFLSDLKQRVSDIQTWYITIAQEATNVLRASKKRQDVFN